MPEWLIWVIVAVVVIAIIAALVAAAGKKKKERNRAEAGRLREQAATRAPELKEREASARETEAHAAVARAEAERKQAEAERLEAEAGDRHRAADGVRDEHRQHLSRADELDPDVNTRSKSYAGPGSGAEVSGSTPHRGSGNPDDDALLDTSGTTGDAHDTLGTRDPVDRGDDSSTGGAHRV